MPIDREKVNQAAQKFVEKKKFDRAIAEYQRIIQEDPNDARTLLKIGDLQARLEAYPEAIATYDRVGQYYSSQGFALKAIAVYKQIRELIKKHAPDLADRYGHIVPKLAEIYAQLGLTSDALAAYDEVATRLQRGGRDREAIDVFRKMVELDTSNPLPHLRLAEACCRVQSLDEAIDLFWRAAELLINLNRRDDAVKVVERILHFRVEPRFARIAAELYIERGTREDGLQALAKLQVCFQADPRDLDTLSLLARAFALIGQDGKALEVQKEMARLAREQGRLDLYKELLQHLRKVAADDEAVKALDSVRAPAPSSAPPSSAPLSLPDSQIDVIESAPPPRRQMASSPDVVVSVDEQVEAAEEVYGPGSFDARAHARKAIVDADSFRKLRLFPKAIETLHIALEIDPRSIEIRSRLRDILIESGDREGAIAETVNLAALFMDRGDAAQAEPLLREVMTVEPGHAAAAAMLEQVRSGQAYGAAPGQDTTNTKTAPGRPALDTYDPNEPLPSYDLEEVGADQALSRDHTTSTTTGPRLMLVDEPFSSEANPLPSFPLGEAPPVEDVDIDEVDDAPQSPPRSAALDVLEEALEEADFFAARGLYEDARAILADQLTKTPNHRLVIERLREVEENIAASGSSQTIERSMLAGGAAAAESAEELDVAVSLSGMNQEPLPESTGDVTSSMVHVDVDQVFMKFKAGVRAQVQEADSATHYDLGVAYKEMGLLAEAIAEFESAARDPHRECMCYAMMGLIYLEQNDLERSSESYIKALAAQSKTVEQEMSLYYDLGIVYEMKNAKKEALYYFQKIARRDPGYRDTAERIAALSPGGAEPPKPAQPARAVGDDDDFERAFDDLFEGK